MSAGDVCGDQMPPFAQDLPGRRYPTCVLPAGHEGLHTDSLSSVPPRMEWTHLERDEPRPPWRFDVPEVPAHVTALMSRDEVWETSSVWVRTETGKWAVVFGDGSIASSGHDLRVLMTYAPLVECEDPRAAS